MAYCSAMEASAHSHDHAQLLRSATSLSVATAVLLTVAKACAFAFTGSVAVLASLVDSVLDASASLLTLLAVRYALVPADDEHRFGHGKSEALAGLGQAVFILTSAGFLITHAIERMLHPEPLQAVPVGIAVMLLSIALTISLVLYQRKVVRATGSTAIRGDALHYTSDVLTNVGTIAALGLSALGFPKLDPIIAVTIASATIYGAGHIGWAAFQVLMDHELPRDLQERVTQLALQHEQVRAVRDLRTRESGQTKLIQMILEMDGRISLTEAHVVSDEVEQAIRDAIPGADVVIHQEPADPSRES